MIYPSSLARLSHLWREGDANPTRRPKRKRRRWWRTCPDPLEHVWPEVLSYLQDHPDANGMQILKVLMRNHPTTYPPRPEAAGCTRPCPPQLAGRRGLALPGISTAAAWWAGALRPSGTPRLPSATGGARSRFAGGHARRSRRCRSQAAADLAAQAQAMAVGDGQRARLRSSKRC